MDAWLLALLEGVFDGAAISPYVFARLVLWGTAVGTLLAWGMLSCCGRPSPSEVAAVLALAVAGVSFLLVEFGDSRRAERLNAGGLLNVHMATKAITRLLYLGLALAFGLLLASAPSTPRALLLLTANGLALSSYLTSVNWSPAIRWKAGRG